MQSNIIGVNISNQIDVIKNPPMRLPLPDYSQSLSIKSSEEPNNFSNNLRLLDSKSPFSITIKPPELASSSPPDDLIDYVDSNSNEHFDFDQADDFLNSTHPVPEISKEEMEATEEESKPQISSSSSSMDKDSKKCQDCSIVFLTPFRLQRHIKKFHGKLTATDPRYGPSSSCLLKLDSY